MTVYVGTSGWQYRDWREAFYPAGLRQASWLDHYAAAFATVELNASFYRLPPPETFARWAAKTPLDFVMCPKASRYLSHMRKLREPREAVERFMASASALGRKLGPILLQLPGSFVAEPARLAAALDEFGPRVRIAVEVRHASWFTHEVQDLLAERDAALVIADRRSRLLTPTWRTASWGYLRFHEGRGTPPPCYGRSALASRAALIGELFGRDRDVYAFFNNDPRCCAVRDARWFAAACRRLGLSVSRVPDAAAVRVRA